MKTHSLRSRLTWMLTIIALIPILLLGGIQVVHIYRLSQEYTQIQLQAMKRMADAVETYVFYHRKAVETIAADIGAAGERDKYRLTLQLQAANQQFVGFTTLYVTDASGRTLAYHAKKPGLIHTHFQERPYFQEVVSTLATTISPVFLSQETPSRPLITIAVPVLDKQQFFGTIIGTLDVSQVVNLVTQYDYGPSAYPVVLDNRGRAIYHPDPDIRQSIGDLSGEAAAQEALVSFQGMNTFYSETAQQDELVAYKVIPELGWIVWVAKSSEAVNADFLTSLESSAVLIALTLLLTLGVGFYLAKRHAELEQRVDSLKNDLISLASHEFKTPITSIRGSVETLLRQDAHWDEAFRRELLLGVHEDIGRIQELVDEWLDISKIEAGALRINPEPIRPQLILEHARRRLPKELQEAASFEVELPSSLPLVYADKNRMEQVLVNLFTNAIRYNDKRPHIRITADADNTFVHIHVTDNGIGISSDHLNKIFDRFYRVDVSASRRTSGTGLGLAICRGIMEAHHGHITVDSLEGKGSTFTVSIPIYLDQDGDNHEETENPHRG